MDKKEIVENALYKLLGFVIYIIVIGILNIVALFTSNFGFSVTLSFLNNSIIIVLFMFVALFFTSFFSSMNYPNNIPAPIFNAAAVVIVAWMLLGILNAINPELNSRIIGFLFGNSLIVYLLIAAFVLVAGYILLLKKKTEK